MSAPELSSLRLVGGTALALQYGHRVLADINKIINNNFANQVIYHAKRQNIFLCSLETENFYFCAV
jgi:hypothetical protein